VVVPPQVLVNIRELACKQLLSNNSNSNNISAFRLMMS